jgi:carboxymethylenebutenolidase
MDQQIINLYDEYTHKPLTREVFIKRLIKLTGSAAIAMSVIPALEGCYTKPLTSTSATDLFTERITYTGATGPVKAYVARPAKEKKYGVVVVIHENRGLNPHIEDVARRAAMAGYLAIAPDGLSPLGGTPANEDEARQLIGKLNAQETTQNFAKAFDYATTRKDSNGQFGCVGFCWGGAMANELAVNVPLLKAAIAYYGRQPKTEDVPKIKAAVQLHYGGLDEGVNKGIPAYEAALKAAKIDYELYIYEGVNHAFHNDTSIARYNEAAAKLSWKRSMDFFDKHLKS